jgi:hypothetical protein
VCANTSGLFVPRSALAADSEHATAAATPPVIMVHWDPHIRSRLHSLPIVDDAAAGLRRRADGSLPTVPGVDTMPPAVFQGSLNLDHMTHWVFDGIYPAVGSLLRFIGPDPAARFIFGPGFHGFSSAFLPTNWAMLEPFYNTSTRWCDSFCAGSMPQASTGGPQCVGPVVMGNRGACNQRGECGHMTTPLEHRIIQGRFWDAAGVVSEWADVNLRNALDAIHTPEPPPPRAHVRVRPGEVGGGGKGGGGA